ncbi:hypothetical protein BDV98DRAFT_598864 [Pterulicium gracile]|uniref:Uncharacterized protein n=1 Tax=Pterulicium gracile TaxID=1884261 RepID=A0A5C3PZC4_9AGAR|nr:hypothetical protein BDV98DRAFT_598864 [Pterula gracilis]
MAQDGSPTQKLFPRPSLHEVITPGPATARAPTRRRFDEVINTQKTPSPRTPSASRIASRKQTPHKSGESEEEEEDGDNEDEDGEENNDDPAEDVNEPGDGKGKGSGSGNDPQDPHRNDDATGEPPTSGKGNPSGPPGPPGGGGGGGGGGSGGGGGGGGSSTPRRRRQQPISAEDLPEDVPPFKKIATQAPEFKNTGVHWTTIMRNYKTAKERGCYHYGKRTGRPRDITEEGVDQAVEAWTMGPVRLAARITDTDTRQIRIRFAISISVIR